jgi:hypothetical protein
LNEISGQKDLMSPRKLLVGSTAVFIAAGLSLPALPATSASAATSGATTATITITGGALAITAPTNPVSLGSLPDTVNGGTVSGLLGPVQVNDARGAAAGSGWVETAISTAFTGVGGTTIAASAVSMSAGAITKVGTATFTDDDPANLTGVSPLVTATGITGDNSATWVPTVTVAVEPAHPT